VRFFLFLTRRAGPTRIKWAPGFFVSTSISQR
jgi:hypothetical protein